MTFPPKNIICLVLFCIIFQIVISCSKDTDLFTDIVLNENGSLEERDRNGEEGDEPGTRTYAFTPINDVYLQEGTSFDQSIIRLQEDYRTSYLMFDLSGLPGEIKSARLQFTINADDGDGLIEVNKGLSNDWTEETLDENSAPEIDVVLGSINQSYAMGSVQQVELSAQDLSAEKLTLVLTHSTGNDLAFASKEHPLDDLSPKLLVTYYGTEDPQTEEDVDPLDEGEEEPPSDQPIDYGELKAFPSAFGGGAYATGGRGGRVIHVTNLNDTGPGSLREAVYASGPRIVVFDVSGTINNQTTLNIKNGDLTIAGHTAPEGGITLTGARTQFDGCDNVIVRYIRVRPRYQAIEQDGLRVANCTNYIFDHVSVSWGTDEVASMGGTLTRNSTFQRMLIAEGKTAALLGDSDTPANSDNFSMLSSLFYNISHRFPNVNSNGRVDVVNNIVYNWNFRLIRTQGSILLNHVNNVYLRQKHGVYENQMHKVDHHHGGNIPQIHTRGNLVLPDVLTDPDADNWFTWTTFGSWSYGGSWYDLNDTRPAPRDFQSQQPFSMLGPDFPLKSAGVAFDDVLGDVGSNKRLDGNGNVIWEQDNVDAMYINRVKNDDPVPYTYGSVTEIPASQHYQAFWETVSKIPVATHPQGYDSDGDGMPDAWELAQSLDPNNPADGSEDRNGDGYTNLEDYLNLIDF